MIPLNQSLNTLTRSPIRVYTNLANATPGCIKLTIGEPDFDTPEAIKAAAAAALQENRTHYAPNQGTEQLRAAIAEIEQVKPEQVLVTVGATQALFTALLGILNPGEEVIVPTPGFGLYESIVTIAGAKIIPLDVTKTGFQIDGAALENLITPKTKAIVLNSPNNPTGVIFNRDSLAAVKNAVLTCYAVEGTYPESLEYLREHYKLAYNTERFVVEYDAFASNVMPEIVVRERGAKDT